MRKPRPSRPKKYKLTDDILVDEITDAIIEVLGERPALVGAAKVRAAAEGLSLDAFLWKQVADIFHKGGAPLPPRVREHIAKHSDMPDALRKKLLTRGLN